MGPPKVVSHRQTVAVARKRRAVGQGEPGKVKNSAIGGITFATTIHPAALHVQDPAFNIHRPGVVKHHIAIKGGGAAIPTRLAERPKVVKQRRAAIVTASEGVVTLRVPHAIVVDLRVRTDDSEKPGVHPVDRAIVGQGEAVKIRLVATGHILKTLLLGIVRVPCTSFCRAPPSQFSIPTMGPPKVVSPPARQLLLPVNVGLLVKVNRKG